MSKQEIRDILSFVENSLRDKDKSDEESINLFIGLMIGIFFGIIGDFVITLIYEIFLTNLPEVIKILLALAGIQVICLIMVIFMLENNKFRRRKYKVEKILNDVMTDINKQDNNQLNMTKEQILEKYGKFISII